MPLLRGAFFPSGLVLLFYAPWLSFFFLMASTKGFGFLLIFWDAVWGSSSRGLGGCSSPAHQGVDLFLFLPKFFFFFFRSRTGGFQTSFERVRASPFPTSQVGRFRLEPSLAVRFMLSSPLPWLSFFLKRVLLRALYFSFSGCYEAPRFFVSLSIPPTHPLHRCTLWYLPPLLQRDVTCLIFFLHSSVEFSHPALVSLSLIFSCILIQQDYIHW